MRWSLLGIKGFTLIDINARKIIDFEISKNQNNLFKEIKAERWKNLNIIYMIMMVLHEI